MVPEWGTFIRRKGTLHHPGRYRVEDPYWHVLDPGAIELYAMTYGDALTMTYGDALAIAEEMGYTETVSWHEHDYSVTTGRAGAAASRGRAGELRALVEKAAAAS